MADVLVADEWVVGDEADNVLVWDGLCDELLVAGLNFTATFDSVHPTAELACSST